MDAPSASQSSGGKRQTMRLRCVTAVEVARADIDRDQRDLALVRLEEVDRLGELRALRIESSCSSEAGRSSPTLWLPKRIELVDSPGQPSFSSSSFGSPTASAACS